MLVTVGLPQSSGQSIIMKWDLSSGTGLSWGELSMRSHRLFCLWDLGGERLSYSSGWYNKIPHKIRGRKRRFTVAHSSGVWTLMVGEGMAAAAGGSWSPGIHIRERFSSAPFLIQSRFQKEWGRPPPEWVSRLSQCNLETSSPTCPELHLHHEPRSCHLDNPFKPSREFRFTLSLNVWWHIHKPVNHFFCLLATFVFCLKEKY